MFRRYVEILFCLRLLLIDLHQPEKKEPLRMNGANFSLKDNFIVKTIAFFGLAIIAFYLLTEHRVHLLAYSSFIIFFVFILMHLFMHSGHGEHGGSGGHGGCCGGHSYGKHNHKETEQKGNGQEGGGHEDVHKHAHSQEKFT